MRETCKQNLRTVWLGNKMLEHRRKIGLIRGREKRDLREPEMALAGWRKSSSQVTECETWEWTVLGSEVYNGLLCLAKVFGLYTAFVVIWFQQMFMGLLPRRLELRIDSWRMPVCSVEKVVRLSVGSAAVSRSIICTAEVGEVSVGSANELTHIYLTCWSKFEKPLRSFKWQWCGQICILGR